MGGPDAVTTDAHPRNGSRHRQGSGSARRGDARAEREALLHARARRCRRSLPVAPPHGGLETPYQRGSPSLRRWAGNRLQADASFLRRLVTTREPLSYHGRMTRLSTMLRSVGLGRPLAGTARERRLIARSGLFDTSYYLMNCADVQAAGADPLRHFCDYGWRENRRPNLFFDPDWYRSRYLANSDENPLVHYLGGGESAGCRPVPFFDPAWYRSAYHLGVEVSPLAHFFAHRRSWQVAPNPHFDLAFYLALHAQEIGRNRDPFMHHVRNGAVGRDLDPSPSFQAAVYRRAVMVGDARIWSGLIAHEMHVPLVHFLDASCPPPAPQP